MHHRVVNYKTALRGSYVYVGRGTKWGNRFTVQEHGKEAMRIFLDELRDDGMGRALIREAREELVGKNLGCACRGRYPVCHAEVWARLADGEELSTIRADLLQRIGLEDGGAR